MRILMILGSLLFLASLEASALEMTTKEGSKMDVPVCGGFLGLKCESNQWCDFPKDTVCGVADTFGTCRPRPTFCTADYNPVCGCNGETFSNACVAASKGQSVAYVGPCRSEASKKEKE